MSLIYCFESFFIFGLEVLNYYLLLLKALFFLGKCYLRALIIPWKGFGNSLYKGFYVINNRDQDRDRLNLIKFQQLTLTFEGVAVFSFQSTIA